MVVSGSSRYAATFWSLAGAGTADGFSASGTTIHGDMDVPKFLPLKGPNGFISRPWISRADHELVKDFLDTRKFDDEPLQSFTITNPKMWSSAFAILRGWFRGRGLPMIAPNSSSKSSAFEGPKTTPSGPRYCPRGLSMGVPETTILDARPAYAIGKFKNAGGKLLCPKIASLAFRQ